MCTKYVIKKEYDKFLGVLGYKKIGDMEKRLRFKKFFKGASESSVSKHDVGKMFSFLLDNLLSERLVDVMLAIQEMDDDRAVWQETLSGLDGAIKAGNWQEFVRLLRA